MYSLFEGIKKIKVVLKNAQGFSLAELVIYLGILGLSAGVFTGVLNTVTKTQVEEFSQNEITGQLSFTTQTIQRLVKASSRIITVAGEPTSTLYLQMPQNDLTTTTVYLENGKIYVKQGNYLPQAITNDKVTVDSLEFQKFEKPGSKDVVQFDVALSQVQPGTGKTISRSLRSAVSRVSAANFDDSLYPGQSGQFDVGNGTLQWKDGWFSGSLCLKGECRSSWGSITGVSGSGTLGKIARWSGTNSIDSSIMYDNGAGIGIGVINPSNKLEVNGTTLSNYFISGVSSPDTNYRITTSGGGIKAENGSSQPAAYFSSTGGGYALQTGTGDVKIGSLAGSGDRVVTVDTNGILKTSTSTGGAGNISGTGVAGYVPLWTSASSLATSTIYQQNGKVGIGTGTPGSTLTVNGTISLGKESYDYFTAYPSQIGGKYIRLGNGIDAMDSYLELDDGYNISTLNGSTARIGDVAYQNTGAFLTAGYNTLNPDGVVSAVIRNGEFNVRGSEDEEGRPYFKVTNEGNVLMGLESNGPNGGHVGIGIDYLHQAPETHLEVGGMGRFMANNESYTNLQGSGLQINFSDGFNGNLGGHIDSYDQTQHLAAPLFITGSPLELGVYPNAPAKMKITQTGVGIGPDSPNARFDVNHKFLVDDNGYSTFNPNGVDGVYIGGPIMSAGDTGLYSTTGDQAIATFDSLSNHYYYGAGALQIADTNVGIGTNAPSSMLSVASTRGGRVELLGNGGNYDTIDIYSNDPDEFGSVGLYMNPEEGVHLYHSAGSSLDLSGSSMNLNGAQTIFQIGGVNKMILDTSGNLGIGTDTPSYKLDVVGTAQFSQPIVVGTPTQSNHAATKSYVDSAVATATSTQYWTASSTSISYNTGNVGIGTASPSSKLDVQGDMRGYMSGAGENYFMRSDLGRANTSGDAGMWIFRTNAQATPDFFGKVGFKFNGGTNDASKQFQIYTADAANPKMVVTGSGYVGIGTTTPSQPLEVNGYAKFNSTIWGAGTVYAGGGGCYGNVNGWGCNSASLTRLGGFGASTTVGLYSGGSERVRIDLNGNVGVGNSPSYALDVNTDIFARRYLGVGTYGSNTPGIAGWALSVSQADQALYIRTDLPTSNSTGRAFAIGANGETYARTQFYSNGFMGLGSGSATRDTFLGRYATGTIRIGSAYDGTGAANLLVNGNIGIATTSPAYALDVAGTGRFTQPIVVGTPTQNDHAATKSYVDSIVGGSSGATFTTLTVNQQSGIGITLNGDESGTDMLRWTPNTGEVTGIIDASGNLGIGTAGIDPAYRITLNNNNRGMNNGGIKVEVDDIPLYLRNTVDETSGTGAVIRGRVGIGESSPQYMLDINADRIRLQKSFTPNSSSDPSCQQGEMTYDRDYFYICAQAGTWKRVDLRSW